MDLRIAYLRPNQILSRLAETPVIFVPVAPLEWHGPHLPLGVDAINAERTAEAICEKAGGLVWPTIHFGTEQERPAQVLRNLGIDPATIRQETSFYDSATTQDFIDVLQKLPDEVQTVCVFGHNPAVYYWVSNLVKYFNGDMPTCSTVDIDFAVDKWADVAARIGKKAFQYIPKEM
jgi:hypothetical protein